ncbi:type IV pilin protein [Dyella japonica]|uniref:PilE protein n=1 Tax=Dyella japonica A8 TaxID=1217721 RepID=A0A075K3U5_9GAMM|nr:type IV pilin protein [Dyella japonica]AIF48886.1 PilE protein [Dyella japonica A8]
MSPHQPNHRVAPRDSLALRQAGFTLIETMIVVAIIGILAAIAYPSYVSHIRKTNRVAAESCMSQMASYMERYYTTYLRYDKAGGAAGAAANAVPVPDCATPQQAGKFYTIGLNGSPGATTYEIMAQPIAGTSQARDTLCGTLYLDQSGARRVDGTGTTGDCW